MKKILSFAITLLFIVPGFGQVATDRASEEAAAPSAGETMEKLPTLTDYFRSAPVYLTGQIRFEANHRLFHDQIAGYDYLQGWIIRNRDLNIWLSRTELKIKTEGGLRVSLAGLPVSVTSLSYNNETGDVDVKSSILGIDAGTQYAEQRMAEEIRNKFRPKLRKAFARLMLIRQQKSLSDAGNALNDVINVFKSRKPGKRGPPLPTFTGELSLVTQTPSAQAVAFGNIVAEIAENDALISSVLIRVPARCKAEIRGLMFASSQGLVIRTRGGSTRDVKTATLKSFSATEYSGFQLEATNGADDILSAGRLLYGLMRVADTGHAPTEAMLNELSPSTIIQQIINAKAEGALAEYVKANRPALLKAGATAALLTALETDHPNVGPMPFMYPGNND